MQTNIEFGSFAMEMAFDKNKDALAKSSLKDGFLAPLYFVNQAFDPHLHPELLDYVHKKITGPLALVSKWPIYLLAVGVLGNGLPKYISSRKWTGKDQSGQFELKVKSDT